MSKKKLSDWSQHEYPFSKSNNKGKQITVKDLKEMLLSLPSNLDDFEVRYDSGFGRIFKEDFRIMSHSQKISLNG